MSASREKKARKELAASGTLDPKMIREQEERAKHRRTNILYGVIAGVFVLVAAFLLLWNSHAIQRNVTAVTIDGTKYSAAEVDYYYHSVLNQLLNNPYASYMGISNDMDLNSKMNDSMRTALGVEDTDITWDGYLKNEAINNLKYITALTKLAKKDGYTFTADMQKDLDAQLAALRDAAKQKGMSEGAFLKATYGKNMTKTIFTNMFKQAAIASAYSADHMEGLTYTDSDLEKYYQEHTDDLDTVSFEVIYFDGNPETKTGEDGKTIAATDEEKAAAKQAAHDAAHAALDRFNAGEDLETIAKDYENAQYNKEENGTNSTSDVMKWLFEDGRKAEDVTLLETDPSCYLLLFHSRARTEARTVDVRHILFQADTAGLDKESKTYEVDVKAAKDAAKAKADEALANWKAGEATEDSFAAMAKELSEDPGSSTNGGLYEKINQDTNFVTPFKEWCLDESRKAGDTGVVETDYGFHVMYFVGDNVPYWKMAAENGQRSADQEVWLKGLVKSLTVTQGTGMKYVG